MITRCGDEDCPCRNVAAAVPSPTEAADPRLADALRRADRAEAEAAALRAENAELRGAITNGVAVALAAARPNIHAMRRQDPLPADPAGRCTWTHEWEDVRLVCRRFDVPSTGLCVTHLANTDAGRNP